jgi:hypothetical protein
VTSWLAARASERVETVFLTATGETEAQIHARVGFERIGEVLHVAALG